jgi:hypothetical protein
MHLRQLFCLKGLIFCAQDDSPSAFGAVAGMGALAKGINNEFNSISSMLASAV